MIHRYAIAVLGLALTIAQGFAADQTITARFEPSTIAFGETAELKIRLKDVSWEIWRGMRVPQVAGLTFVKASSSSSTTRSEGRLRHEHVITLVFRTEGSGAFVVPAQVLRWEDQTVTAPEATLQVSTARKFAAVETQEAKETLPKSSAQLQVRNTRSPASSQLARAAHQP